MRKIGRILLLMLLALAVSTAVFADCGAGRNGDTAAVKKVKAAIDAMYVQDENGDAPYTYIDADTEIQKIEDLYNALTAAEQLRALSAYNKLKQDRADYKAYEAWSTDVYILYADITLNFDKPKPEQREAIEAAIDAFENVLTDAQKFHAPDEAQAHYERLKSWLEMLDNPEEPETP